MRPEISKDAEKNISRWTDMMCGFCQGESYSLVEFCVFEIPVYNILQESKG